MNNNNGIKKFFEKTAINPDNLTEEKITNSDIAIDCLSTFIELFSGQEEKALEFLQDFTNYDRETLESASKQMCELLKSK